MAGELIWSRTALDDLESIAAWIARDSATHARLFVERAFACGAALISEPGRQTLLLDLDTDRVLVKTLDGFRMLYERHGEDVHVLAILYGEDADFR